ncbi:MAG: YfcC family protein [Fusobacterium sp.]
MKKRKNFNFKELKFPHTYVIIFSLVCIATLLTWIIPAGEFDRVKDQITGKQLIVNGTFKIIKGSPVNFLEIPLEIIKGLLKASSIVYVVLIVGGAFNIIIETGMFQAFTGKITKNFGEKEGIIIPVFTTTFALACMTMGVNTFIGFAPVSIILARSLGYDAIVGVSMVMLGGAIGFSTGTFNPFTTGVAQSIAGLPMFSGVWYRFICLIVFLIVTNIYLIKYAKKIKKNPELSYVKDLELEEKLYEHSDNKISELEKRHYLVFIIIIVLFGILIYGGSNLKWKLNETGAIFIWMGILSGLAYGYSPSKIASLFVDGSKKLVFGALLIGIARSISLILSEGQILDTTVFYLGNFLSALPSVFQSTGMFLMQLIINGLITSGSGQAAVTMPIMLPVSDLIGMTRQASILAFNFGDGFSNYVLPTSSALMGFLAISKIPYDKWIKFIWKLFIIWVITGSILIIIADFIKLGPF